jgi:hypothetical protein
MGRSRSGSALHGVRGQLAALKGHTVHHGLCLCGTFHAKHALQGAESDGETDSPEQTAGPSENALSVILPCSADGGSCTL